MHVFTYRVNNEFAGVLHQSDNDIHENERAAYFARPSLLIVDRRATQSFKKGDMIFVTFETNSDNIVAIHRPGDPVPVWQHES